MKGRFYFLLLLLVMNGTIAYSATFNELKAPDSRRLLYNIPSNFNGSAVIFFHGAQGNAQVLINDAPTADIIQKMLDAGFLVVLPEARQDFKVGPYIASWESNTETNPDTKYVDWIIDTGRQALPQLKEFYLMGGSNGVSMASRIAKNHQDIAGMVAMNGLDADQFSVNPDGSLVTNDTFSIPVKHAPILMISSKQDGLMSFASQQKYLKKARQAGVSSMVIVNEDADHNWGEWTIQYHDDIVGWLRK
ncbi:MAG: hypothetical protein HOP02_05185 [Methylococcaceae bacterium]|nr:hypothetical protein [Methylococcaceae bacterium]